MWKWTFSASVTVVLTLGISGMADAQFIRSCGKVSSLSTQGAAPLTDAEGLPYIGMASLQFIPSLCVSERYDTNVFYAPKTPGLKKEDFVTNVNPMLHVNHNGGYAVGYLDVGGFGESYARNSDLNYFGTSDNLYLNLDKSIKRLLPNASLIITDYVRYTPTPPGYSNPVPGTSPGSPVNVQNPYAQGLLAYRANNLTNTGTVQTSYKVTPLTSFNASYSNSIIRFGSSSVNTGIPLFDTTIQTGTVGATTQLNPLDTLNLSYAHSHSEFTPHATTSTTSTAFSSGVFKVDTVNLGWTRILTPYLTAQVGSGVIVIEPKTITYALNASIRMNTENHSATLSYVRSVQPSFIGIGVPITSNVISLSAIQKLALHWELDENLNYSHGSGGSDADTVTYNTYSVGVDLYYWITKIWSTALSFDYQNFQQEFASAKSNFDRYVVTLSVKATWN